MTSPLPKPPPDLLRAPEVGVRLGISTKEALRLMLFRKIRYVMFHGIPHVPVDAVEEYRAQAP